ncbi:MAG: 6,7-dimethyl-8-ribityllumazine synthase, partial [Chloroflexota bacterium]
MTLSRGTHDGADLRIAIVASRFNELVTDRLVHGALDALKRSGVPRETIDLAWVPGSFELPQIAKRQALSGNYDAVICLGAVIRGETAHFDFVAAEAAAGI